MKPTAKQLNVLVGQANWNTSFAGTIPAATSILVTSAFAGNVPGGTNSIAGVYTTAPQNKVYLRNRESYKPFVDLNGNQVIGRLTESGGTWTLTFYSLVAGSEVAYNFTGTPDIGENFDFRWCESIQLKDASPTAVVDFGEGIDEIDPSSPLIHDHHVEAFIATAAQTVFSASFLPKTPAEVGLFVNGIRYNYTTDYTVVTTTVTWLDTDFVLAAGDVVTLVYMK